VPPLPLASDRPGRATTDNHSVVSPIAIPRRLFPARAHFAAGELTIAVGSKGGDKGLIVKVLKVLGS
jgi:hypothetical protein